MDVRNTKTNFVFRNIRGKHAERCASSPDFEILKLEDDEQHLRKISKANIPLEDRLLGKDLEGKPKKGKKINENTITNS